MPTLSRSLLAIPLLGVAGTLSAQAPALDWSTFLGGPAADACRDVAVDAAGDVFVLGETSSATFPTTNGAYDRTHNGGVDVFVAKFAGSGRELRWATLLGDSGDDRAAKLTLATNGDVVIAGTTRSTSFPTTAGAFNSTPNGGDDAFVARIDRSGATLVFATLIGGTDDDAAAGVAITENGAVIVAGTTRSTDFPTTTGALQTVHGGGSDGFVARLDAAGTQLAASTFVGGSADDAVLALALDLNEQAWIGGCTASTDYPTSATAADVTLDGNTDGSLARISGDGRTLLAGTFVGGSGDDAIATVATGDNGTVLAGGTTSSNDFPTTAEAFDTTLDGGTDGFVIRLDEAAAVVYAATLLGGSADDAVRALVAADTDSVAAVGTTTSADFPTTPGGFDQTYGGAADGFVAIIDWHGEALDHGTFLGDAADDTPHAVTADGPRALVTVGATRSVGFPTTPAAYDTGHDGQEDAFVTHLETDVATETATPFGWGTAGEGVRVPVIETNSDVYDRNRAFGVVVRDGRPNAPGLVFLALSRLTPPFPLLGFALNVDPATLILDAPVQLGADGYGARILPLPTIDPSAFGSKLIAQVVVQDAAAPQGWAATRGLELTVRATPSGGSAAPGSHALFFTTMNDKDSAATQAFLAEWQARGLTIHYDSTVEPYLHVHLPAALDHEFSTDAATNLALEFVATDAWMETDGPGNAAFPDDPRYATQWGVPRVGGPVFLGPRMPRVAVIDGGVFIQHEELDGIVAHAFDLVDKDNDTTPGSSDDQHGTLVCGAFAAATDNGKGITGLVTRAPWHPQTAWVHSYRAWRAGRPTLAGIHDALQKIRAGTTPDVITMSASVSIPRREPRRARQRAIERLRAETAETLIALGTAGTSFCASSGNTNRAVRWPASLESTVAVGATSRGNPLDRTASFSCRGSALTLTAPGEDLILPVFHPPTSDYKTGVNGTSFSTPMVAGVLAAIHSHTQPAQDRSDGYVESLLLAHAVRDVHDPLNPRGVLDVTGELILSKQNGLAGASGLRFPMQTPTLDPVTAARPVQAIEISPDRGHLVYSDGADLWLVDRPRPGHTPGPEIRLTANDDAPGYRDSPVFTPDGEMILFTVRDAQNNAMIRWVNRDGTASGMVTPIADLPDHLHVSPDGKRVVFVDVQTGIVSFDLSQGTLRVELPAIVNGTTVVTTYGHPRYSPDGQTIAAYRVDISTANCFPNFFRNATSLLTVEVGGGKPPKPIAAAGSASFCHHPGNGAWVGAAIWCPTWSPNGRHLYYLYSTNIPGLDEVRAYDFRTQEAFTLRSVPSSGAAPLWSRQRLVSSRW